MTHQKTFSHNIKKHIKLKNYFLEDKIFAKMEGRGKTSLLVNMANGFVMSTLLMYLHSPVLLHHWSIFYPMKLKKSHLFNAVPQNT